MSGAASGSGLIFLLNLFCLFVVPQVLFPSGAKVTIQRTFYGMNVFLYTPRANDSDNEKGLCLDPEDQHPDSYGESLRYCRKCIRQIQFALYYTNSCIRPSILQGNNCFRVINS